jgi:1-acyl-sn-glycerol-3-phosphate acyltransferase
MMYPFTRPLATIALSTFYRKVYLVHADRIPKDKPVLLAVNHPTAFIEPCILACWLDFPLHFMVRGDLFAKPFFNWLLRDYHMIPIYRMKDGGFSQIKRNFSTMAEAMEVLKSGKAIMMLVEGGTGAPNRLRPLQKGAARLALGTLEHFPDSDVQIVPIGVNYSESNTFRSLVMLEVGHPIPAGEYLNAYRENPNQGIRDLTRAVRQGLLPCVIHVESEEDEQTAGQLLEMVRNDHPLVRSPFAAEKKVANWINDLDQEDKDEIADQVKTYQEKLAGYKLTDRVVAGEQQAGLGWVLVGCYGVGSVFYRVFSKFPAGNGWGTTWFARKSAGKPISLPFNWRQLFLLI